MVGTKLALCKRKGALGDRRRLRMFTGLVERLRFGAERIDRLLRLCGGDVDMGDQHGQYRDEEKRTLANDQSHWRLLAPDRCRTASSRSSTEIDSLSLPLLLRGGRSRPKSLATRGMVDSMQKSFPGS